MKKTIIGLGKCGSKIAQSLFQSLNSVSFNLLTIDHEPGNDLFLLKQDSPERYEENVPDFPEFKTVGEEVFFVIGGSGNISGASLRILHQLRDRKLKVIYIKPDLNILNTKSKLQERAVRNILQEYALSGLFEELFMFDNKQISDSIPDLGFLNFFEKINENIVYSLLYIEILSNSKAIFSENFDLTDEDSAGRIETVGVVDLQTWKEKSFFDLKYPRERKYFFSLSKKDLDNPEMKSKIEIFLKKKKEENDRVKIAYGVFDLGNTASQCYFIQKTSVTDANAEMLVS